MLFSYFGFNSPNQGKMASLDPRLSELEEFFGMRARELHRVMQGTGGRDSSGTWCLAFQLTWCLAFPVSFPALLLAGTLRIRCLAHIHKCIAVGHAVGPRTLSLLLLMGGRDWGWERCMVAKKHRAFGDR